MSGTGGEATPPTADHAAGLRADRRTRAGQVAEEAATVYEAALTAEEANLSEARYGGRLSGIHHREVAEAIRRLALLVARLARIAEEDVR